MVKQTNGSARVTNAAEAEETGRRGFLRIAAMTAGGVVAAGFPQAPVVASAPRAGGGPRGPVSPAAGPRPGEPYFFRIGPTTDRRAIAVDAGEA